LRKSSLYVVVRRLLELIVLFGRKERTKALEILVLRHELSILRRQVASYYRDPLGSSLTRPAACTCSARGRGTWPGRSVRELLRARRLVLDLLRLAQGVHRFVDGQEDCRFERAKRAAAADRERNRGHGHVVGGLP
jgi:hypothetical protein